MELGEAEAVGVFDDHYCGVGNIYADFDDDGCDEDIGLAGAESAHCFFFLVGGHLAVEEIDFELGKDLFAQYGVFLYGGFDVGCFVFVVDAGADEEGLLFGAEALADEVVCLGSVVGFYVACYDFAAARGGVFDYRDIEIAECSHCEGSRDGGCGHYEAVGGLGFAEFGALVNAELVLFVDDDHAKVVEVDVFVQQGNCADEDVYAAGFCVFD